MATNFDPRFVTTNIREHSRAGSPVNCRARMWAQPVLRIGEHQSRPRWDETDKADTPHPPPRAYACVGA
jgi:hypothetical protein